MPYDSQADIQQILAATLSLLEHAAFDGKDTKAVQELKRSLRDTMSTLEIIARSRAPIKPEA